MSEATLFAKDSGLAAIPPKPRVNLMDLHARELCGQPESWSVYKFERKTPGGSIPPYFELVGAVAPPLKSGPRKGRPNWSKLDKATERTVVVTVAEHDAWCEAWEAKTGNCRKCVGTGQESAGWSKDTGTKWRTCGKCGGTGKAVAA